MKAGLLLLLVSATAAAQTLIEPGSAAAAFDAPATGVSLRCEVKPVPPALNFGLRFQAGYVVRFPLTEFTGAGHRLRVVLRVTPEGAEPAYLADKVELPNVPQTKADGTISGWLLVGEGDYRVEARVEDERHRVCRGEWRMHARRGPEEKKLIPAMALGAVATLSSPGRRRTPPGSGDSGRLTVLLHAAPLRTRSPLPQPSDIQRLTGSLAALLERVPARSVRLVVFNLDQRKELLRRDAFDVSDIDLVAKALNDTQLGAVDYRVLTDPKGASAMFAALLSAELAELHDGDALVTMGPEPRVHERAAALEEPPVESGARVFYLEYRPLYGARFGPEAGGGSRGGRAGQGGGKRGAGPPGLGPGPSAGRGPAPGAAIPPDTIQSVVKRFKGTVRLVRTPEDFARAVGLLHHNR